MGHYDIIIIGAILRVLCKRFNLERSEEEQYGKHARRDYESDSRQSEYEKL
jgi:hypothetical protein